MPGQHSCDPQPLAVIAAEGVLNLFSGALWGSVCRDREPSGQVRVSGQSYGCSKLMVSPGHQETLAGQPLP